MQSSKLLEKIGVKDKTILLDFIASYSRIEYALKRNGYTIKGDGKAEADWPTFIKENKEKFNPQENEKLKQAVEYLLSFPAKQQIILDGKLDFREHEKTKEGPCLCRIYHCIRITRNNLFHGGKFPNEPVEDLSRNTKIIQNCLTILERIVEIDPNIKITFWETE